MVYIADHGMRPNQAPLGVAWADVEMLQWLAQVAREARQESGRKQSHFAAAADVDQSTITRFEQGIAWPRNADRVVSAYAEVLDIPALELWARALKKWREEGSTPAERTAKAGEALERLGEEARERRSSGSKRTGRAKRAAGS